MSDNLIKQHKIYSAKLDIPKDVQHIFGKKAFKQTLNTSDRVEAKLRADVFLSDWKIQIHNARGNKSNWELLALAARDKATEGMSSADANEALGVLFDTMSDHFGLTSGSDLSRLKSAIDTGLPNTYFTDDYIEQFEVQYRPTVMPKTCDQSIAALRKVGEYFKKTPTRDEVEEYIVVLYSKYARNTVLRYINTSKSFFDFLIKSKDIPTVDLQNPFKDHDLKTPRRPKAWKNKTDYYPFSPTEIVALYEFASGKNKPLSDAIVLAMFTGCRIEELYQIRVEDYRDNVIHIMDPKTRAGLRQFPAHKMIRPLLDQLARKSKDGFLLPTTSNNKYGVRSSAIGKSFGRLKTKLGYSTNYVFHSIRATVVTQFEQGGLPENVSCDVVGHEKGTIGYGHYSGGSSMAQKEGAINLISYPNLTIQV